MDAADCRLTMAIELFDMERMQSTWENLVDYDMSESGVRPLTLRELVDMGFDLDAFLDHSSPPRPRNHRRILFRRWWQRCRCRPSG